MSFKPQARELHKQVVIRALCLDPNCTDYALGSELLRRRAWFRQSQKYVLHAQAADRAAEEAEKDALREKIRPDLEGCRAAARQGTKALLKHLYNKHCPPFREMDPCVNAAADIPRAKFMRMMSHFHP